MHMGLDVGHHLVEFRRRVNPCKAVRFGKVLDSTLPLFVQRRNTSKSAAHYGMAEVQSIALLQMVGFRLEDQSPQQIEARFGSRATTRISSPAPTSPSRVTARYKPVRRLARNRFTMSSESNPFFPFLVVVRASDTPSRKTLESKDRSRSNVLC